MNPVPIRGSLVGQVIDGRFSLIEWVGGSGTSGVFLTEISGAAAHESGPQALLHAGPGRRPSLHLDGKRPRFPMCTL